MAEDIIRVFDPSQYIPIGLRNARIAVLPDSTADMAEVDWDFNDGDSGDESGDELEVPGTFVIISQTIRNIKGGTQVVDVVIDVEEVEGAVSYEVRLTK